MKNIASKITAPLKFFSKAVLLILLLLVGWAFVNVANFIKGKKSQGKDDGLTNLLGPNKASADTPPPPKDVSTPFLAYFDGSAYRLENDILFGRPKSYYHSYEVAKSLYDDGRIYPDLYKINAPIQPHDGKLKFQIQEIELEESYFKWLQLKHIIHPKNTEVFVDSEYRKFYVVEKKQLEENVVLPDSASVGEENHISQIADKRFLSKSPRDTTSGLVLQKGDAVEITFKNLKPQETVHLVVKSWFRDWVLGLAVAEPRQKTEYSLLSGFGFARALLLLLGVFIGGWLSRKSAGGFFAAIPFFIGYEYGSGKDGCCFAYQYKDKSGNYRLASISEPRAWQYNTEFIELPKEAVLLDGTLSIKMTAGRKHVLGFIGAVQGVGGIQKEYREEEPELLYARHNRLEKEVSDVLKSEQGEYVQTIPGDTIDLEFASPELSPSEDKRETYLIRASGFYTALRDENRVAAGNWRDKISEEARARLSNLV